MERLLKYFEPIEYDIKLHVFTKNDYIDGTVTVFGKVKAQSIKFHAVNMKIKSVDYRVSTEHGLGNNPETHELEEWIESFQPCRYGQHDDLVEVPLTKDLRKHLYDPELIKSQAPADPEQYIPYIEIRMTYETQLNRNMQGCYVSTYQFNGKRQKIIATQFESHYAREAFPCIDEPAAKAKFNLTLVVPDRSPLDVVIANTPLESQDYNCFTFAPTPRMSTYLLAWVIGPLRCVSGVNKNGVKVTSYCALNQSASSLEFANEVAMRALEYYDEKFGIKYPLPKLDQVALPDFEAGAMENWGLVTYRESCMLAEPNAALETKQSVAVTVTHELSHQWFGDLVTMAWWDDLWLNEAFATIMEYYATDALYPELEAWPDFYTGDCVAALRRDALPGVQAVCQDVKDPAEIATLFDSAIVYAKGARLVLMLMRLMGEENFYRGVQDYFQAFQYQNTVGDDLWNKLQSYADFDVREFMHAWISQPGYPRIWTEDGITKQARFLVDGTTDDSVWPIPEVKDDMSGHYLINLDEPSFQAKLNDFDNLSEEQKFRLLIDRMLLAKAESVQSSSLLDVLPKFANENAAIWDILLCIVNELKIFFTDESPEENLYRTFLRNIIYSRIRELGVINRAEDDSNTKRLRKILLVIARFARDEEIIGQLAEQYQDDLTQIDAELRGNILMAKMITDEDEIFPVLLDQYQKEIDPEIKDDILFTLASARQPEHIEEMLTLLSKPDIVRPQDHIFLYIYLLRNPKSRAQAIDWLYNNWPYIEKITGDKSIEDYLRCTAEYINARVAADQFYEFFGQYKDNPILKRTFAMATSSIETRLALIAREAGDVHNKLRELIKD